MKKQLSKPSVRQNIKEEIVRMIGDEMMLPGDKIMPQNELAARFGTTPVTIHKALRELVNEGVIERRKGVGTFVSKRRSSPSTDEKRVCLIVHRSGLDQPQINPYYWPYMQDLIFEFSTTLADRCSFSLKFAGPQTDVNRLIQDLQGYYAVFFHYSDEVPNSVLKAVVRSRVAPVIKIGKMQEKLECLQMDNDRFEDIRLGTNHLIQLGNKRLGYLGASEWWGDLALAGFRSVVAQAGLKDTPEFIFRVTEERAGGVATAAAIAASEKRPDAIVVDSDLRALGLVEELRNRGIRVPEEISVLSHDGLQMATMNPPFLTSVKIPYGEMIATGLKMVEECNGKFLSHRSLNFCGKLIEGKTTLARSPGKTEKKPEGTPQKRKDGVKTSR